MKGLMQDWPLLVHTILDHAATWHGSREIVSRTVEGPIHRYTYRRSGSPGAHAGVRRGERTRVPRRARWSPPWPGTAFAISNAGTA
jgi:hypothetical protein